MNRSEPRSFRVVVMYVSRVVQPPSLRQAVPDYQNKVIIILAGRHVLSPQQFWTSRLRAEGAETLIGWGRNCSALWNSDSTLLGQKRPTSLNLYNTFTHTQLRRLGGCACPSCTKSYGEKIGWQLDFSSAGHTHTIERKKAVG